MGSVVGAVDDDRVVGDPEVVQMLEQLADPFVMVDHRVVVLGLPAARLAHALGLGMGSEMHLRGVRPDEEGLFRLGLPGDEVLRLGADLVVDRLHPLLGQRAGILDRLGPVGLGLAVEDAARAEVLAEIGKILLGRIVAQLRLLAGVQVVEEAEELVEPVLGRQELVLVAEVVLAELAGGVAQRLQQLGDGRVLRAQAQVGAGKPHLAQSGAKDALPRDEGRPARRAALLGVAVGKDHSFIGDAVDVRGPVPHHALGVGADVGLSDVIPPDDENVRLLGWHSWLSSL